MKSYSAELKDSIVAKMLPPHNVGVAQLVRETGIPRDTLYGWRSRALARGAAVPMGVGVWLHVTERHDHPHRHERLTHTHMHRHDEHHQHEHPRGWDWCRAAHPCA